MSRDGGLRPIFHSKLKDGIQWTAVETGGVSCGVPDSEYAMAGGITGWVEFKKATGWQVPTLRSNVLQIGWIARRARYGARMWIGVRRCVRRQDELWLVHGSDVEVLAAKGLRAVRSEKWDGGPGEWNWEAVRWMLTLTEWPR